MSERNTIRARKWAAVFCLAAVLFLQGPFAQAAWIARQMACCASGQCTIPSHHHKTEPAKNDLPMQCDHQSNGIPDCKMSCCKTSDETATNVQAFLLPYSAIALAMETHSPGLTRSAPQLISRAPKPQSPPPKLSLS